MSDEQIGSDEGADSIERVLEKFAPAALQIDRDRLMFLAGQASVLASGGRQAPGHSDELRDAATGKLTLPARRRRHWFWPASTAALATTSLALALTLFIRPVPGPQIVYVERPAAITPRKAERTTEVASAPVSAGASKAGLTVPPDNYLRTREVALRMGLDAIGAPRASGPTAATAPTYGNLLQGLDATPSRSSDAAPWIETLLNM